MHLKPGNGFFKENTLGGLTPPLDADLVKSDATRTAQTGLFFGSLTCLLGPFCACSALLPSLYYADVVAHSIHSFGRRLDTGRL